ncbi:MAG TPA: DUF559 domain-containing protein [Stellaceae bacterium]
MARRLRRNATDAEKRLWRAVRELLSEHGCRRQHPVGTYIVDFACPAGSSRSSSAAANTLCSRRKMRSARQSLRIAATA